MYYIFSRKLWLYFRINCGDTLFVVSKKLVYEIINKIQCSQRVHLAILQDTFDYFLYVLSELYSHGKISELKQYLSDTDELLCSWISHHNVIGGSSIGGVKAAKVQEELQVC